MKQLLTFSRELFLFILLILFVTDSSISQDTEELFSLPGLRFGVDIVDEEGYTLNGSLFYRGDTLHEGNKYLIYQHYQNFNYYMKIEGDKLYEAQFSLDSDTYLMFDFGMEIGDTIDYGEFPSSTLYFSYEVIDKSIIQLEDGIDRVKIDLEMIEFGQKASWIQGIGWLDSGPIVFDFVTSNLKCVTAAEGEIYLAENFTSEECDRKACLEISARFAITDSDDNKVFLSDNTRNIDEIEMHMGDGNVFNEFVSEYEYLDKGCYDIEVFVRNSCGEESYYSLFFDYCEDPKWYENESIEYSQLSFYSSDLGLAIEKDSIFKTTDGGESWTFKTRLTNSTSSGFGEQSIHYANENLAVVAIKSFQETDKIFVTKDGGDNWEAIYNGPLYFRQATISDEGVIIATTHKEMIRSTDFGETWTEVQRGEVMLSFDLSNFVGNKIATVNRITVGNSNQNSILISEDFGLTWTTTPFDEPIFSIYFLDQDIGYLGGNNTIYKTLDGGDSWVELKKINGPEYFTNFSFSDANNGIATTTGNIYVTKDGGQSWELEDCKNETTIRSVYVFQESSYVQRYKSLYERAPNPDFECDTINSTDSENQLAIEIAPNPSSSNIHIIGSERGIYLVEIRDVKGAIQLAKNIVSDEAIDINQLSMGMYFVSIQKGGQRQTFKLLKH